MCEFAYMKLYVADLDADTRHLSASQFGAYVRILGAIWRKGGSFPLHHSGLARIAGVDAGNWKRHIWPAIKGFFRVVVEEAREVITQKRLSAELLSAKKETERKRALKEQRADHAPGRGVPLGVKPLKNNDATSTDSIHVDSSFGRERRAQARARTSPKPSFATKALNALDQIEARLAAEDPSGTGSDHFGDAALLGPSQTGADHWLPANVGGYASGRK